MLKETEIREELEKEYQRMVQEFGKQHILATFVMGIANYGFAESKDEIVFKTVYLPGFEELCLQPAVANAYRQDVIDIRSIYSADFYAEDLSLELLFSDYMIVTPKYQKVFNESLYQNRELFSHYSNKMRITKAFGRALEAISQKNYFEAYRLKISAELFCKGVPTDECFHLQDRTHREYLKFIKRSPKALEPFDEEAFSADFMTLLDFFKDEEVNQEIGILIKEGVLNVMGETLHNAVPYETFIENLTATEKRALSAIENELKDGEGNISISKLIASSKISRPIFDRLLKKMQESNMAEIKNQGSKGTYVNLKY